MAEEQVNSNELEVDESIEEELEEAEPSIPRPPDEVKGTCPACPSMAPAWMATFADMATLLMAFFVLILSFVEMETPSIFKRYPARCQTLSEFNERCPALSRRWLKI